MQDKKNCIDYLERDVSDLPEGSYVLHARLGVPSDGEAWPVSLTTHCRKNGSDGARKERGSTTNVSAGSKEDGYRLWGLTVDVPGDQAWASDCTWELSAPHPQGDNVFVGSWKF